MRACRCWGQLGDSKSTAALAPQLVPGGIKWAQLSVGVSHTCGISAASSAALCWGQPAYGNQDGQLGIGTTAAATAPTPVAGGRAYASIVSGQAHTCAIEKGTSGVYCWGRNVFGQLANASMPIGRGYLYPQPVPAFGGRQVSSIGVGWEVTCAILAGDSTATCAGSNNWGLLGSGSTTKTTSAPQAVAGGLQWAMLLGGLSAMFGVSVDGSPAR